MCQQVPGIHGHPQILKHAGADGHPGTDGHPGPRSPKQPMPCPCPGSSHALPACIHHLGSSLDATTMRKPLLSPQQPLSPASPILHGHPAPQHPKFRVTSPSTAANGAAGSWGGHHGPLQKRLHPTSHQNKARGDTFPAMSLSQQHPRVRGEGRKGKGVSASTDLLRLRMTKGRVPSPLTEALSHLHPISPRFGATKKPEGANLIPYC